MTRKERQLMQLRPLSVEELRTESIKYGHYFAHRGSVSIGLCCYPFYYFVGRTDISLAILSFFRENTTFISNK